MSTSSTWYRRTLWNYKGNREYTRSGYEAASVRFVGDDLDVDCSDRHYMITGSNSGIGLQAALEVARRGGIIHMVCRNQEAATKARSEIITTTGNDKIHLHIVDLAKPREVVSWAQRFAAQHEHLHVVVHNAGCMVHERRLDEDGVEVNFAVNTLAVHIITLTLMPLLERSEDARVVIVSSAGMLSVRLIPNDLMHANMDPFDGRLVYSQNKRQQVVMGLWYAQRFNKVHFSSMHPGWVDTNAVRTSLPQFYEMMKDNLRTPEQGADTVVWLAISKGATKHPSGLFFQDREPVSSHLPLAWTKTTIAEEDTLMQNIQEVYINIYNKIFPQSDGSQAGASGASPSTSEAAAAAAAAQTSTEEGSKSKEEGATGLSKEETTEVQETSLTETPLKTDTETLVIPVLPPPPPPAGKVVSRKEVQEVAEIHAPPSAASQGKDTPQETKEEPKPSESQEEKKTDGTEGKTEKTDEKRTEETDEKTDTQTPNQSQEKKTDIPEEITHKTEEKGQESSGSTQEKDEERTEEKEAKDITTPASSSNPALPEP